MFYVRAFRAQCRCRSRCQLVVRSDVGKYKFIAFRFHQLNEPSIADQQIQKNRKSKKSLIERIYYIKFRLVFVNVLNVLALDVLTMCRRQSATKVCASVSFVNVCAESKRISENGTLAERFGEACWVIFNCDSSLSSCIRIAAAVAASGWYLLDFVSIGNIYIYIFTYIICMLTLSIYPNRFDGSESKSTMYWNGITHLMPWTCSRLQYGNISLRFPRQMNGWHALILRNSTYIPHWWRWYQ